jgi:hypothetical protein
VLTFKITLHAGGYFTEDETFVNPVIGTRTHKGTPATAIAAARRTRVGAESATIECIDAPSTAPFTIGVGE